MRPTTSCEVQPWGLSTTTMPGTGSGLGVLGIGLAVRFKLGVLVGVLVAGVRGALAQTRAFLVAQARVRERLVERGGRLRHRVKVEVEGRREADAQLRAHER